MKLDRSLIQVNFVTWLPAEHRLTSNQPIPPDAKIKMFVRLWAPLPLNELGQPDPSKAAPEDQGVLWAIRECIRIRPDGREVLAILGTEETGILESTIVNQPKGAEDGEGDRKIEKKWKDHSLNSQ